MPDPSAGEVGGVFAGVVALVVAFGHGIRWLLNWDDRRKETRQKKLDRWHRELEAREEKLERQQEEYQQRIERQLEHLQRQQAALVGGYQLIAGALRIIDPNSPALRQADDLLRTAFPLDPLVPGELQSLALRAHRSDEES
jgi:uncharacterized protein HemX